MSMFIKRPTKNVDNVNEDVRVYLYVPIEYKEQAKELGAQWEKPKLKWFSYKSNPNLQKLVDIFHQDNFRTDFYGEHMKAVTKTKKERIEDKKKESAEYKKLLRKYKKRAIDDHGKWTVKDKENFGRWYSVNKLNHE